MKLKITNKKIDFFKDLSLNTFSFAIYIIAQQIIFMPIMGKELSTSEFANFVIYISVFSILTNSLGNELGITSQIFTAKKDSENQYLKLLFIVTSFAFIATITGCFILKYGIIESVMLSIVTAIANIRLYISGYFRKKREYKYILFQNLSYLIGIIAGTLLFKLTKIIFIPTLIAEIVSLAYTLKIKNIFKNKIRKVKIDKEIITNYRNFGVVSFLGNALTYFDKIIIYPILGAAAVNAYYSTNTMSKIVNTIINPVHGVLLTWIKKGNNEQNRTVIWKAIKASIVCTLSSAIIAIPTTYIAVKILYGQFLVEANTIIMPISLTLGFSVGMTIMKSFVMKFLQSRHLVIMYIAYILLFVASSIYLSNYIGLFGFALACLISKIFIYMEFIISTFMVTRKTKKIISNENR